MCVCVFVFVVLRAVAPSASPSPRPDLCYRVHYHYNTNLGDRLDKDAYTQSRLVRPATGFPSLHSKVVNGVCGGANAGDTIPAGSATCTNCKWAKNGETGECSVVVPC